MAKENVPNLLDYFLHNMLHNFQMTLEVNEESQLKKKDLQKMLTYKLIVSI